MALSAEDLAFLHNYRSAFERVNGFQMNDPQPIPGGLIDTAKHLNNLPFAILDSIEKMIPNSRVVHPKTKPEPLQHRTAWRHLPTTTHSGVMFLDMAEEEGMHLYG